VRLLRLQQVLCGTKIEVEEVEHEIEDSDDVEVMTITSSTPIGSRRLEVLYNVLMEHDGPAVIWARFTDDINDIVSFLEEQDHRVVSYHGETSETDRAAAVRAFASGEAKYFVANPDAAGTGLDGLQIAQLAVYYSNSFRAESRWQSEDRIHRIGMVGRAHYVDLVSELGDGEATVDHLVLQNLKTKGNLAKAVFENPSLLNASAEELAEQEEQWAA
jgi:superfamily II DNA/RNA helicase